MSDEDIVDEVEEVVEIETSDSDEESEEGTIAEEELLNPDEVVICPLEAGLDKFYTAIRALTIQEWDMIEIVTDCLNAVEDLDMLEDKLDELYQLYVEFTPKGFDPAGRLVGENEIMARAVVELAKDINTALEMFDSRYSNGGYIYSLREVKETQKALVFEYIEH